MKGKKKNEITDNSKVFAECYIKLYKIDKKIIKYEVDEYSDCLESLLELKGEIMTFLCKGKSLKQIRNEIDDLLWNINARIDTLKNMALTDGLDKRSFLGKYKAIYNSKTESKALVDFSEAIQFYIIAMLGIFAVKVLKCSNIIVDENDGKYIILLTYIYFLLGRAKKISLDGMKMRKPKNWKENIRN